MPQKCRANASATLLFICKEGVSFNSWAQAPGEIVQKTADPASEVSTTRRNSTNMFSHRCFKKWWMRRRTRR
jgi:hypothetical protein